MIVFSLDKGSEGFKDGMRRNEKIIKRTSKVLGCGLWLQVSKQQEAGFNFFHSNPESGKSIMKPITLIIADDHPIFRIGMKDILEESEEFTVVGEAENGDELLRLMAGTTSEMVILDLRMSDNDDGLTALKAIKRDYPEVKVLIMSQVCNKSILDEVLELGADGYITKNDITEMLIPSLKSISKNKKAFSPRIQSLLMNDAGPPGAKLTRQEKEILRSIKAGKTREESAQELDISISTVNFHRKNIKSKLQAKNLADMIRIATENLLI